MKILTKYLIILCLILCSTAAIGRQTPSTFLGCNYPSGDVWQTKANDLPLDPNSQAYIAAVVSSTGGNTGFTSWQPPQTSVNMATNATPLVTVLKQVSYHQVSTPMPWMPNFIIQPPGTDQHASVLNTDNCMYYESYSTSYNTGTNQLTAYSDLFIDLTKPFVQPTVGGNSTATGIPFGLMAIRPEELTAGWIGHAIGWDGVSGSWSQTASVSPAGITSATDGHLFTGTGTPMPYGAHARLKTNFNISAFPPEAYVVAKAMKQFGMYAYDTGCCNTVLFIADKYGTPVWTSADAAALATITPSDLEIVQHP